MNFRLLSSIVLAVVFAASACAQDPGAGPQSGQNGTSGSGGGYGQRGGRGGFGGGMMGRGLMGTVTQVASDHYTIKTETGDIYTVNFTADTRMFKREARSGAPDAGQGQPGGQGAGPGGRGYGGGQGEGGGRGVGGNPPQQIKSSDIKTGDVINVMGETDATAKTVNARAVALMDQQTVDQIRTMEANFGKTWLMGKVTAIDGTKITLTGTLDNAPHTIVADENTEFRKRRDPITLADIQVGDTVRADGAAKDGVFTATAVNVFAMNNGGTPSVPRGQAPQAAPGAPPANPSQQNSSPQ